MVNIKSGTYDWESNLQSSQTEFAALIGCVINTTKCRSNRESEKKGERKIA
jgi:hypothetical protein